MDEAWEATGSGIAMLLRQVGLARRGGALDPVETELEARFGCHRLLAVYGTLVPGGPNHHLLDELPGRWFRAAVRGRFHRRGWGMSEGFPAFRWDEIGELVEMHVLRAENLPAHWDRLDAFEGEDYVRILAPARLPGGRFTVANLYELRRDPGSRR